MSDIYDPPFEKPAAKRLIVKARKRVADLDEIDRRHGFATPQECHTDCYLRTVLSALQCGIETNDWSCVADAYVMLQGAEERVRTLLKGMGVGNG